MVNNFVVQPTKEGETKTCEHCKKPIISRLKVYKDYPDKIQWQDKDKTEAHYDKMGDCKGETQEEPKPTDEKEAQLKAVIPDLDIATKKIVCNETLLLVGIRKEVQETLKDIVIDPHPGMIWEITHAIWLKYFGEKEK